MPTVEANYNSWNNKHAWTAEGDEWSEPWGSARNQWYTLILPRIQAYLPAEHILEIAPGFGRWTQFLLNQAGTLSVVDLSEKCIEHCRQRFKEHRHIRYAVNDGRSLAGIDDQSIDFIFSFDSLVHAEYDVIRDYLAEFKRVLRPGGIAWIHHSNLAAEYHSWQGIMRRKVERRLKFLGFKVEEEPTHWRAKSVSADLVRKAAQTIDLQCRSQEVFKWRDAPDLTDCISVFQKSSDSYVYVKFENGWFKNDISQAHKIFECYGRL